MKRPLFTSLLLLLGLASALAAEKPNILFIMADDLGWKDVGYNGSEIRTPHIDKLAKGGLILDQHYVTPMCSSTRACLLSGRYSTRFGLDSATNDLVFPMGMTTLAGALQEAGYVTGLTGKWHLGSKPEWGPHHFGFDQSYGAFAGGVDQYLHLYKKGPYQKTWHRNMEHIQEEGHATDLFTREAIRWIEQDREGKPFYIQVAYTAVHIPIQEPEEWVSQYEGQFEHDYQRHYAACATHMDHCIGEMVEALKRTGQLENTLIIFTSDNGGSKSWEPRGLYPADDYLPMPTLGDNTPLRGFKGQVYEGGVRVPAFVSWPGKLPARSEDQPIHIVDWMPTLCALTGAKEPENAQFDGQNIWSHLIDASTKPEDRQFYFKRGSGLALRQGDWKLVVSGKKEELFNLAEDPNETTDLAQQQPEKVATLRKLLEAERKLDS